MNLMTIPRLPAEPAPILGKSLRQQREEREAAERAAKPGGPPPMISAPAGYELTPQGGFRRVGQPAVIPETKGRALKAGADMAAGPDQAVFVTITGDGQRIVHTDRDDGPCGVVPSAEDVGLAWYALLLRGIGATQAWAAVEPFVKDAKEKRFASGFSFSVTEHTPADRRADVIKALNKLGS